MASTSSPADSGNIAELRELLMEDYGIVNAAFCGDLGMLKMKREEIGDDTKFRRMCDLETDSEIGYNALHVVVEFDKFEIVKFLIEEMKVGIDVVSHNGVTPLLITVKLRKLNTAKYLIEWGAEINKSDSEGFTALHWAVMLHGDTEFLALLLTKGADIEADSVSGTPLDCAAKSGRTEMVKFLLEHKAEPNSVSKYDGTTPLVSAIYSNTVKCVDHLLEAGADPKMFVNGLSPLAHAVERKSNSCIQSLINAGADVDAVSSCGLSVVGHAALVYNFEAIMQLVQKIMERRYEHVINLWKKGDAAFDEQDYSCAIASYTEALQYCPKEEKLWANRRLCWERTGEHAFSLCDMQKYNELSPVPPKPNHIERFQERFQEPSKNTMLVWNTSKLEEHIKELSKKVDNVISFT